LTPAYNLRKHKQPVNHLTDQHSIIYCVTHKPVELQGTRVTPLQVGEADTGFCGLRDNTGTHIAPMNPLFSELTAHYWVWKNRPSAIVGFCHYRRYLLPPELSSWVGDTADKPYAGLPPGGVGNYASGYQLDHSVLTEQLAAIDYPASLGALLTDAEILLPHPNALMDGGFIKQYGKAHPIEPFYAMLAAIARIDNDMGKDALHFFTQHPHAHWNNLFVMRWELFAEYCNFQFDVLLSLVDDKRHFNDNYQNRYCAFLSERLFNFWVWHKQLNALHLDWCMTEDMAAGVDAHQRRVRKRG